MSGRSYEAVEFGEELPPLHPDVSLANVKRFVVAAGMSFERFTFASDTSGWSGGSSSPNSTAS